MDLLLMFMPEEAWVLFLVAIGIGTIIGIFTGRQAMGLILTLCLLQVMSPFFDTLLDTLPDWVLGVLAIWFTVSMIGLIFGTRVRDSVISMILFSVIAFPFRVIARFFSIGRKLK